LGIKWEEGAKIWIQLEVKFAFTSKTWAKTPTEREGMGEGERKTKGR